MTDVTTMHQPQPGEIEAARNHPNGWVYRILGEFPDGAAVPREAIVGAWKVDGNGLIYGEFVPNPNFLRDREKKSDDG